jgi:hypothetical protein
MPRRSSLVAYFSLTYLLAWAVWLAAGALTSASLDPAVRGLVFLRVGSECSTTRREP